ncbi:DUF4114 domain-containing protein [Leptolyngbya sp. PCC 6406]|uniref:DUF4114 domain-containing protein n=1 Tax=Leptolyngbya sp. PCC 6406 TaxID=1173264 RepID=UPI0002AD122D|nr:DUF4114 domain-containing protein [Leptolyngbya sp. PCC 6406]
MKFSTISCLKGLAATTALLAATLSASAAQAISLTTEQWSFFNSFVQTERQAFTALDLQSARPDQMMWSGAADALEVYFINEGAGYRNQLLFSANGGPLEMVFNDVSSPNSILRNADGPLALGEGRNLGGFSRGTNIQFFVNSNGYSRGENETNATRLLGPDPFAANTRNNGLQHIVAYDLEAFGSNWLLFGFEDIIGGGDLDYNDVVFVVRGLTANGATVPEPGAVLGFAVLGAVGLVSRRGKDQSEEA